jgi:hypothetical protein
MSSNRTLRFNSRHRKWIVRVPLRIEIDMGRRPQFDPQRIVARMECPQTCLDSHFLQNFFGAGTSNAKYRRMSAPDAFPTGIEVKLDGFAVEVPPERRSVAAIRSYLELLALQQQRILCSMSVDGKTVHFNRPGVTPKRFSSVEAETMALNEMPMQLIKTALQQTSSVKARVQSAVELVLINGSNRSQELWWNLATALKEPLLTLSLLPEDICGPANGRASLLQLRKWQLQQLGYIIQEVDQACHSEDPLILSDALEKRALAWVNNLYESLRFWHEAISDDLHPKCQDKASEQPL